MNKHFAATMVAAALCAGGQANASVITFDDPGPIDIDNATNIATYTESGFTLSGPAATFLPLDASLVGGIDAAASLTLKAVGGGTFSLMSLDDTFFDLGFGNPPGTLSVSGLLNGVQVASQMLSLGGQATAAFGSSFGRLTEVTFVGSSAFALDNINATAAVAAPVPEPSTMALTAIAMLGLVVRVRQRRRPA